MRRWWRWRWSLVLLVACERKAPEPAPAPAPESAQAQPSGPAGPPALESRPRDAAVDAAPALQPPFGTAKTATRPACSAVKGEGIADRDLVTSFVDGDALFALVNRSPTGALAPGWAPSDLVDLRTGREATAAQCEKVHCLRKDAAAALGELLDEMKRKGFPGRVESAFRSYAAQCGTFAGWTRKSSFCAATEQSALPGHSQHQLGTTVDLFTEEWAKDPRGVFRAGFGCTPAGLWLREHAFEFGFVMPYPIHPDDRHPKRSCVTRWDIPVNINPRTGYRYEHWHFRYLGKEAALRFEEARKESGPGTPGEITLEQWLRAERKLAGTDAELPVCDGCNCGACSTLAAPGQSACDKRGGALHLDDRGLPVATAAAPKITGVKKGKRDVDVTVEVAAGVATQPPIDVSYGEGSTFEKVSPYPETQPRAFPAIEGAWVVGVEPVPNESGTAWPYRAALSSPAIGRIYNRANVRLPARPGKIHVKVTVPRGVAKTRVVLLEGGVERGEPITCEAGSPAAP